MTLLFSAVKIEFPRYPRTARLRPRVKKYLRDLGHFLDLLRSAGLGVVWAEGEELEGLFKIPPRVEGVWEQ